MQVVGMRCENGCHRAWAFITRFFRAEAAFLSDEIAFGPKIGIDLKEKRVYAMLAFGPFQIAVGLNA